MEVTTSKREICIPLEVLLDNLDSAEFIVDQLIETDITSFADDETSLLVDETSLVFTSGAP